MSHPKIPVYRHHDRIRDYPDPPPIQIRPVRVSSMTDADYIRHAELVHSARERGAVAKAGGGKMRSESKKKPPEKQVDQKNSLYYTRETRRMQAVFQPFTAVPEPQGLCPKFLSGQGCR